MTCELGVVGCGRNPSAAAGPVCMEELATRFVYALISVGAKEVTLGLQQVGRQTLGPVAIEK